MQDIEAAADAYLLRAKALRGLSAHTLEAYASDLRDFGKFVACAQVPASSGDAVLGYATHLSERGAAPRTVRRRLACLKGFFRDQVRRGSLALSPFDGLDLQVPRVRALPRALARDDAARLAVAAWQICADPPAQTAARDLALGVLMGLSVGLRVSELVGLKWDDYDRGEGTLRIRGKGSRDRTVFIVDPRLRQELSADRAGEGSGPLIRLPSGRAWSAQAFRQRLHGFARRVGVTRRVTPHMLRHTAATLLLEDGVDVLFLQRLLGHESISTTALYAHVADASLRRALERAGLLASLSVKAA